MKFTTTPLCHTVNKYWTLQNSQSQKLLQGHCIILHCITRAFLLFCPPPVYLNWHRHSWDELVYSSWERKKCFTSASMEYLGAWPWSSEGLMWLKLLTFTSDTLQLNIAVAKNKSINQIALCQRCIWYNNVLIKWIY